MPLQVKKILSAANDSQTRCMSVGILIHMAGRYWQGGWLETKRIGSSQLALYGIFSVQTLDREYPTFWWERTVSVCTASVFSISCRLILSTKWETEWIIRRDYFLLHRVPKIPSSACSHSFASCIIYRTMILSLLGENLISPKFSEAEKSSIFFLALHKSLFGLYTAFSQPSRWPWVYSFN